MLVAVIHAKSVEEIHQQLKTHIDADAIELRLDYCDTIDMAQLITLRPEIHLPIIVTLRKTSQGGLYRFDEATRQQMLLNLCEMKPDYMDLEYDLPHELVSRIHEMYPNIKLICSYHDFKQAPDDLDVILKQMQHDYFYAYKIAVCANSIIDTLRMMLFVKTNSEKMNLTGICMGELGQATRILAPIIGSTFNYVNFQAREETAPGQLQIETLNTIYHYQHLNTDTKIYALLGDPIQHSVGHIVHNEAIRMLNQNAVYIKLHVTSDELPDVVKLCRQLPFAGFSITMPLKEIIIPLLDELDANASAIKAVNTVGIHQQHWVGYNTDGLGALYAITRKMDVTQQKIIILGAGGAAKAIAYTAIKKGANVLILNRTPAKAKQLSAQLGCEAEGFEKLHDIKNMGYAGLINTLPFSTPLALTVNDFIPNTIAMDIVYQPIETPFLKIAKEAHCVCIPGYEMYIQQALLQLEQWFSPSATQIKSSEEMMQHYFVRT